MSNPPQASHASDTAAPIVARAGRYYRNARYLMFAIIMATGAWFLYDGFVKYPAENAEYDVLLQQQAALERAPVRDEAALVGIAQSLKEKTRHREFGILLQKILGFTLLPTGLALLVYWLYRSRGEIRLEDSVITLPGHPPIPLNAIDEVDKEFWDRKGIAFVYYSLDDGTNGKFRLDDFIYQAHPIRAIMQRVEDELLSQDHVLEKSVATQPKPEQQGQKRARGGNEPVAEPPAERGNY